MDQEALRFMREMAISNAQKAILKRAANLRDAADQLERDATRLTDPKTKRHSQLVQCVIDTLENTSRQFHLSDFARYAADLAKGEEL